MSIHFLCPIGIKFTSLVDDGFSIGLAFAAGFPEAFSSSCIGTGFSGKFVNTVHNFDPRYGLILKQRLNFNFNTVSSAVIANLCPRLGQIVHCFGSTLLYELLLDLVATYILGIKIDFLFLLVTEQHRRIVHFRTISNLLRSIVWITSGLLTFFSNRCSFSCNRFPCRSSLACTSARGGCVIISCLSSWPDAAGFPGALWPTGNSSIISATAPQRLSWLTEKQLNVFAYCLWSVLMSFFHWYIGIPDARFLRNSAAVFSAVPCR